MVCWLSRFSMFLGRICLALIFLWSALDKLMNFKDYSDLVAGQNLSHPELYLLGAVLIEIFGGLSLILGYWCRFAALVLLIYMIPTTTIFHDFWLVGEPSEKQLQTIFFLKNLAIFGGLLYVLSCGPGLFCCTGARKPKVDDEDID